MLFKRNNGKTTRLLDKLVKGQRIIIALDGVCYWVDSSVVEEESLEWAGLIEDGFPAYAEIVLDLYDLQDENPDDEWDEVVDKFLEYYDSSLLYSRGIYKQDGARWSESETNEWFKIACDAEMNAYAVPYEEIVARQLNLLVGGDWQYEKRGVYTVYADLVECDDERIKDVIAEIEKDYVEYVSDEYVVHDYEYCNIDDVGYYIKNAVEEIYGADIDWPRIVVDEEVADEIIRNEIWSSDFKYNYEGVDFLELQHDLQDELGMGLPDAMLMVSALAKIGIKVVY